MSRILKWPVPVDDEWHEIGTGSVTHVDTLDDDPRTVYVWTIEDDDKQRILRDLFPYRPERIRVARVYGTGQEFPGILDHLGSCVTGPFVWHVLAESGTRRDEHEG